MFKNKIFKIYLFLFLVFSILFISYVVFSYYNKFEMQFFYDKILETEKTEPNISITAEEVDSLRKCKSPALNSRGVTMGDINECLKVFYEKFTLENGVNKAFLHLKKLEKDYPEFVADCHYISHGIGHAEFQNSKGDVGIAFSKMAYETFINNIATCGNGYFHGVIEEFSKNEKNIDQLVEKLKNVCLTFKDGSLLNKKYRETDCYHGVGHALFIQTDYNLKVSLNACDRLTDVKRNLYDCYSGVFMQATGDIRVQDHVDVKDSKITFKLCNSLDEKYKMACINQDSSLFMLYSNDRKNFSRNINFCKQISSDLERLSCINFYAAYAFTNRYTKIEDMCVKNTSNQTERILCVGIFALRTARSIDITKTEPIYRETVEGVCGVLNKKDRNICIKTSFENPNLFSMPSMEIFII
jgi:hypothetical protein